MLRKRSRTFAREFWGSQNLQLSQKRLGRGCLLGSFLCKGAFRPILKVSDLTAARLTILHLPPTVFFYRRELTRRGAILYFPKQLLLDLASGVMLSFR